MKTAIVGFINNFSALDGISIVQCHKVVSQISRLPEKPAGIFSGWGAWGHHRKACKGVAVWGFGGGAVAPDAGEVLNF